MKKTAIVALIILLGTTIWYLFIKKYDYEISFKANAAPGSIYNVVKNLKSKTGANIPFDQVTSFESIKQTINIDQQNVVLEWYFKSIGDTITAINVGVISHDHPIKNRIKVLLGSSSLVKLLKQNLIDFRKKNRQYTNTFRVIIEGESEIPKMQTLFLSSRVKRSEKASEMMKHNAYLHPKLIENEISKKGFPYIKIKDWNLKTDQIDLEFGFPIVDKDSLPIDVKISSGSIHSQKALKATYYGNYRNSDEAWFALLAYANKNNIIVEEKPLEIFYNNPMHEVNEKQWKAEIYLPIKN